MYNFLMIDFTLFIIGWIFCFEIFLRLLFKDLLGASLNGIDTDRGLNIEYL